MCSASAPRSASLPTATWAARQAGRGRLGSDLAERRVDPAEVGGEADQASSDRATAGRSPRRPRRRRPALGRRPDISAVNRHRCATTSPSRSRRAAGRARGGPGSAAESDPGRDQVVHADVEGEHVDLLGPRPDHQGGPPAPAPAVARGVPPDQAGPGEIGRQGADGRAVELHRAGQLGPRSRPVHVDVAQQGRDVVPRTSSCVEPPGPATIGNPRNPDPILADILWGGHVRVRQRRARRETESTAAASSSTAPS